MSWSEAKKECSETAKTETAGKRSENCLHETLVTATEAEDSETARTRQGVSEIERRQRDAAEVIENEQRSRDATARQHRLRENYSGTLLLSGTAGEERERERLYSLLIQLIQLISRVTELYYCKTPCSLINQTGTPV